MKKPDAAKKQRIAKPTRSKAARCVLSHNNSLYEYNLMKASFQRLHHPKNCFARTLTNKQQCNPENSKRDFR
ncbi:MAG: hypothetical protein ACI39N_01530, partial [Lachnospiraceae bacterium]